MLNSPSDKSQFNEETIQNCFTVEVSHNQHEVSELTTPHLCLHECGPCTNVHGRKSWSIELGSSKSTTYQWRSFWPLLGNCLLEASTSKIDIEELEDNHRRCNTFIPMNPVLGPWLQGKFQARSPCFSPGMVNASHRLAMAQIWQFLWLCFQTATCLQPKGTFNCPIAASRHSFIPQEEVYSKAMHNAPSKGQLCA